MLGSEAENLIMICISNPNGVCSTMVMFNVSVN